MTLSLPTIFHTITKAQNTTLAGGQRLVQIRPLQLLRSIPLFGQLNIPWPEKSHTLITQAPHNLRILPTRSMSAATEKATISTLAMVQITQAKIADRL